jgi:hypothetical protein
LEQWRKRPVGGPSYLPLHGNSFSASLEFALDVITAVMRPYHMVPFDSPLLFQSTFKVAQNNLLYNTVIPISGASLLTAPFTLRCHDQVHTAKSRSSCPHALLPRALLGLARPSCFCCICFQHDRCSYTFVGSSLCAWLLYSYIHLRPSTSQPSSFSQATLCFPPDGNDCCSVCTHSAIIPLFNPACLTPGRVLL